MTDYAFQVLCWIAAAGLTGYIEFAVRVFREEGFDRG